MLAADKHRVPAGSALAVDREAFACEVTSAVEQHPNVTLVRERVDTLPDHPAIIATGPLTSSNLAEAIAAQTGEGALAFFDAIAPIVYRESIDMSVAWMAARWDKGGKDYTSQLSAGQGASTRSSSGRWSMAKRCHFTTGRRIHLISRAACPSR